MNNFTYVFFYNQYDILTYIKNQGFKLEKLIKAEFTKLLKDAGLSKKDFSGILGTSYQGVNNWGTNGRDYPYWVESWLNLYIENKKCKELKQMIKDSGACD